MKRVYQSLHSVPYAIAGYCKKCPASIKVRTPEDRRKRDTICHIYCSAPYDKPITIKFLKEQRDKIDILMEDIRQNNNSVGHESDDSLMEE